jgi:hypothetical protein
MSVRDLIPWKREESRVPNLFRDSERSVPVAAPRSEPAVR